MKTLRDIDFDDIRPYRDHEAPGIFRKLRGSGEFEKAMKFMAGKYPEMAGKESDAGTVSELRELMAGLTCIGDFQREIIIKTMMEPMIKHTVRDITFSGLENISRDSTYLYIGNHRDITLDPAIMNYILYKNNYDTTEIAFGDNLLINEFVSDLIRLNRSFIVRRNLPLMKQLEAAKHLSRYIRHTLGCGRSVWIAQREGRAKDGNDFTNPALISMLRLAGRDREPDFSRDMNSLNIVPAAVSYEFDPCDRLKALEIHNSRVNSENKKNPADDLMSMNRGISGQKGRVHYSFGKPLRGDLGSEKELARLIDISIAKNYRLWPSNYIAFDELNSSREHSGLYTAHEKEIFDERIKRISPDIKKIVLEMYANPVRNSKAAEN